MTEVEKSFERIQRRRMVLTVVGNSRSGYDLRDREQCVFYFGDGQFILRPITVRTGNCEEDCTAIHMTWQWRQLVRGVGRHRNNQRLFIWSVLTWQRNRNQW